MDCVGVNLLRRTHNGKGTVLDPSNLFHGDLGDQVDPQTGEGGKRLQTGLRIKSQRYLD